MRAWRRSYACLFGRRAAALLALLAIGLACEPPAEKVAIVAGATYSRSLAGKGPHRFRFDVPANRFLHLSVETREVDVVVLLEDPDGRLLFETDGASKKGLESVFAVTSLAGEHRLIVEPFHPEAKGDFVLRVRELRSAQPADRLRAAAEAAWSRAERRRLTKNFEAAAVAYGRALAPLAAARDRKRVAEAEWHQGEALLETGELRRASAVLQRAAARFRALGDGVGEARALNDLGSVWRLLGDLVPAESAHRRSLDLYRVGRIELGVATAHDNLGVVLKSAGNYQGALEEFQAALQVWRHLNARAEQAVSLQNLGSLYLLIGYDDEALDFLRQALDLLSEDTGGSKRLGVLGALGTAESVCGRHAEALQHLSEAVSLAERTGDPMAQAGAWNRYGIVLRALDRGTEAEAAFRHALEKSRAAGSRPGEGGALANLGWLDLARGRAGPAQQSLRSAAELLARSGDAGGEAYARTGLSRAERQLGSFGEARLQAERAVRLVDGLRAELTGPESRGRFVAARFDSYEELVTLLMDLDRREPGRGYDLQALEAAERARARNLEEVIAAGPERETAGSRQDRRRRTLQAEVGRMEQRRRTLAEESPGDPRLTKIDRELRARWLELDHLAAPRPLVPPLTVGEIQTLAGDGTLLIVYQLAEPASFAWTVDRESVVAHFLPGRERIEKLARRAFIALSQGEELALRETAARAARDLSQAILAPLTGRLAGRHRLAVLADGALHLVPFAALPDPDAGATAEPLLVRHEIVMVPSAAVLSGQRRRLAGRAPAPRTVAVLADPLYSLQDERLAARPASRAAAGIDPGSFQRLPFTAREAEAIVRLVPPGEALLATGAAASRELVLSGALSRYRMLHFATHGLLDPILPERSGLVLSQVDSNGKRRNGFLSAPDVAALDLPADLAVLSGCQTGLGRELRGEGLVGLAHAFFRAGTRRIVESYWEVKDRATAELMARFYRGLLIEGLAPSAALRQAQLSLRADTHRRSPFDWAAFALHGDWQ